MSLEQLFNSKCEIRRYGEGLKKGNFTVQTDAPLYTGVPCRATLKSTTNSDSNGRTVVVSYYILRLPKRYDIQNGDLVRLNGSEVDWTAGEPSYPNRHHIKVVLKKEAEV